MFLEDFSIDIGDPPASNWRFSVALRRFSVALRRLSVALRRFSVALRRFSVALRRFSVSHPGSSPRSPCRCRCRRREPQCPATRRRYRGEGLRYRACRCLYRTALLDGEKEEKSDGNRKARNRRVRPSLVACLQTIEKRLLARAYRDDHDASSVIRTYSGYGTLPRLLRSSSPGCDRNNPLDGFGRD